MKFTSTFDLLVRLDKSLSGALKKNASLDELLLVLRAQVLTVFCKLKKLDRSIHRAQDKSQQQVSKQTEKLLMDHYPHVLDLVKSYPNSGIDMHVSYSDIRD